METLYKTQGDDACFAAAELIDVSPAQPIGADEEVFECGSPRLAPQLFSEDVLGLQGCLDHSGAMFVVTSRMMKPLSILNAGARCAAEEELLAQLDQRVRGL